MHLSFLTRRVTMGFRSRSTINKNKKKGKPDPAVDAKATEDDKDVEAQGEDEDGEDEEEMESKAQGDGESDEDEDDDDEGASASADDRIAAVKAEFGDEDPKFALKAISEGWSLVEAKAHYADKLRAERKKNGGAAKSKKRKPVRALADDTDDDAKATGGDVHGHQFEQLVQAAVDKGMTRQAATMHVAAKHPAVHEAYVAAANPGRDVALT